TASVRLLDSAAALSSLGNMSDVTGLSKERDSRLGTTVPSRVITRGVTNRRAESGEPSVARACSTDLADARETWCSSERPPHSSRTLTGPLGTVFSAGEDPRRVGSATPASEWSTLGHCLWLSPRPHPVPDDV